MSFLKTFSSLFDFGCKPLKIAEFFWSSREHIIVGLSVRPTEIKNARVSFRLPLLGQLCDADRKVQQPLCIGINGKRISTEIGIDLRESTRR